MPEKSGLDLVWSGATSGAYAACFGYHRKVTEVYALLYGKEGKNYNTGRVSVAIHQLAKAGYLTGVKHPTTTWRLYTSTLNPVYDEADQKKVAFDDKQKTFLESYLGCLASKPVGTPATPRIAFDRNAPAPAMGRLKDELHGLVSLSFVHLFFKQLEGYKIAAYVDALSAALGEKGGNVKPLSVTPVSDSAAKLSIEAKLALREGTDLEKTLLFKLGKYLYQPPVYDEAVAFALQTA